MATLKKNVDGFFFLLLTPSRKESKRKKPKKTTKERPHACFCCFCSTDRPTRFLPSNVHGAATHYKNRTEDLYQ